MLHSNLYDIEPTPVESDYTAAFQMVESLKRSLVIVFTDLFEPSAASPLIRALPTLRRKHAVIVASATDPEMRATLARQPKTDQALFMQAATLDVIEAQRSTERAVARTGARTVVANSHQLGLQCVGAYLNEKRRASF